MFELSRLGDHISKAANIKFLFSLIRTTFIVSWIQKVSVSAKFDGHKVVPLLFSN